MLYLFLTGKRAAYLNDIFTVMYLPESMEYTLKYKDAEINSIVDSSANMLTSLINEEVMVLFNDEQGKYIPLRWGTCVEISKDDSQIYYRIKLRRYCHVVEGKNVCSFIDELTEGSVRCFIDETHKKGILATCCRDEEENKKIKDCITERSDSWIKTVTELAKQECLRGYYPVFTKLKVIDDKSNKIFFKRKRACMDKNNKEFLLYSQRRYTFSFSYYVPQFNNDPMGFIPIDFTNSDNELGIVEQSDAIMSEQNKINIRCVPCMNSIKRRQSVQFNLNIPEQSDKKRFIQYARSPVKFDVMDSIPLWFYYVLLILCVLGIAVCTYISTLDYTTILANSSETSKVVRWLCEKCQEMQGTQNLLCSAVSAFLTFGMVKLVGKPKL